MARRGVPISEKHPDLVHRLINPEDANLGAGSNKKIPVWCDGTIQGGPAHERVEYQQVVASLTRDANGCTVCGLRGSANSIRVKRPDLVKRLVNPADASLAVAANKKILVQCDGTMQGGSAHERVEYQQVVASLTKGQNGCTVCGLRGSANSIRVKRPDLIERLVNPEDANLGAGSNKKIPVWCDGTAQGSPAHERVEYQQAAGWLTKDANGCTVCGPRGSANSIRAKRPDLIERLVNPADASLAVAANKKIPVQCDGTMQGGSAHERVEYQQLAGSLTKGQNGCTVCGPRGSANSIRVKRPDLIERLVNPADASLAVATNKKILVQCDGAMQGGPAHERVEYQQAVSSLTEGKNGCTMCGRLGSANSIRAKRPDLVQRLVNPEDASLATAAKKKIPVQCDGAMQGGPAHERVEYQQSVAELTRDRNGCTVCGHYGSANSIRVKRPDLVERLVNEADASLAATANKKIPVQCDGTAQGGPAHERVEYQQVVASLTRGKNGCTVCGHYGSANSIRVKRPDLVQRLVNPEDASLATAAKKKIPVQCDGAMQGGPAHERVEYQQLVGSLTGGLNGCHICSQGPSKARSRMIAVIQGVIEHVDALSGAQMLSLVLRRYGIKEKSEVGQAILAGDEKRLRDLMDELQGKDGDESTGDLDDTFVDDGNDAASEDELDIHESGETGAGTVEDGDRQIICGGDDGSPDETTPTDGDDKDEPADPRLPALKETDPLAAAEALASMSLGSDEQAIEFLLNSSVHMLWQALYRKTNGEQESFLSDVRDRASNAENEYARQFYGEFLRQHDAAAGLQVPDRWAFGIRRGDRFDPAKVFQPNLMQKHMAVLVAERRHVGNWSSTGSGKTASAVLAAMTIDAKNVLVVCPNNTVEGWKDTIESCDPTATVVTKTLDPDWGDSAGPRWLVLNYDKIPGRHKTLSALMENVGFEMLVIDEVHWAKQRSGHDVSSRSETLRGIRKALPEDAAVLTMSATPVVNDMSEGKSLVELVDGKDLDLNTSRLTLNNIVALHENIIRTGFRATIKPKTKLVEQFPVINMDHLHDRLLTPGLNHTMVDAIVAEAYRPHVVDLALDAKARGKGLLVYSEFVHDIIDPLTSELRAAGLRVGHFTGHQEKVSIRDLEGNYDVLIGTRAIGTGVDGVQHWADTVCYVSLPWTSAEFEQSKARVYRQGTTADSVKVVVPMGRILLEDGKYWSWTEARYGRIQHKRDVASAAVDGDIPQEFVASKSEATKAALAMLHRLSGDELTGQSDTGDLTVADLGEETHRRGGFGDFSRMNGRWNNSNSDTTHSRLEEDPAEWHEYHRLYRKARETWETIPAHTIAEKIAGLSRRRPLDVADLGCGEMLLAKKLAELDTEHVVTGFDHVAYDETDEHVVVADVADLDVPDESFDVAVLSLALMGRNHEDYLQVAHRILDGHGRLFIAETVDHLGADTDRISEALRQRGFSVVGETEVGKFVLVEAAKSTTPAGAPTEPLFAPVEMRKAG